MDNIFIINFFNIKNSEIKIKNLKNIKLPLTKNNWLINKFYWNFLYLYIKPIFNYCQLKLHDIIRQIIVEATIPAISAAKAANKIPLVFLIPTQLV